MDIVSTPGNKASTQWLRAQSEPTRIKVDMRPKLGDIKGKFGL